LAKAHLGVFVRDRALGLSALESLSDLFQNVDVMASA
jgi:hypothetical protein